MREDDKPGLSGIRDCNARPTKAKIKIDDPEMERDNDEDKDRADFNQECGKLVLIRNAFRRKGVPIESDDYIAANQRLIESWMTQVRKVKVAHTKLQCAIVDAVLKDTQPKPNLAPLECPVHGRMSWDHVTTQKTCGLCMEEQRVDAGRATRLIRM